MKKLFFGLLACVFLFSGSAFAGYEYKAKMAHEGGNVTPAEAFEMVQENPNHTFIVDVRTRPEYQLIGHPVGASNIPVKFWNGELGEKGYGMSDNPNYAKDLLARFNPETDTLIFMCRSGGRSCFACIEAIKAGWKAEHLFNMLGGFEGDKIKNKNSIYDGHRKLGGWKNEGLPLTYKIDKAHVYKADLTE